MTLRGVLEYYHSKGFGQGLGFRVWGFRGLGFRGLGFRGLGFRVWGLRGLGVYVPKVKPSTLNLSFEQRAR